MYDLVLGRFKPLEASNTEHLDNSSSSDMLRDTSYQQRPAGPSMVEGGDVSGETDLPWRILVSAADQQYQREFRSPGNEPGSEASDNRAYPEQVRDLKAYLAKRKSIEIPDSIYHPTTDEYEKIRSIPRVLEVAIDLNEDPDVVIDPNMVQKSAKFMKDQDAYVSDNELPSGGSIRKPKLPGTRAEQKDASKKRARENGKHVRNYIKATYGYEVPKKLETPKQILEFAQRMDRENGKLPDLTPTSVTSLANRKYGQNSRPGR
jgi:hypothetical protein